MSPVGAARVSRNSQLRGVIPDSVVYQYPVSTFTTSTWIDNVGSADMTVNGMVASTFSNGADSVFGDGTNDVGTANGPQDLPTNDTFGLAFTVSYSTVDKHDMIFAAGDPNAPTSFQMRLDGGLGGNPALYLEDDGQGTLRVETDSTYNDGTPHAIVVNKTSASDANDIDIYVDTMSSKTSSTVVENSGFDPTNYSNPSDMGFYAYNKEGSFGYYSEADAGIFEFNSSPYSQSERDEFVSRRPEV